MSEGKERARGAAAAAIAGERERTEPFVCQCASESLCMCLQSRERKQRGARGAGESSRRAPGLDRDSCPSSSFLSSSSFLPAFLSCCCCTNPRRQILSGSCVHIIALARQPLFNLSLSLSSKEAKRDANASRESDARADACSSRRVWASHSVTRAPLPLSLSPSLSRKSERGRQERKNGSLPLFLPSFLLSCCFLSRFQSKRRSFPSLLHSLASLRIMRWTHALTHTDTGDSCCLLACVCLHVEASG